MSSNPDLKTGLAPKNSIIFALSHNTQNKEACQSKTKFKNTFVSNLKTNIIIMHFSFKKRI